MALTSAKTAQSEVADRPIVGDEAAVYADRASYERKERRNALIAPIRASVERVFGTLKRSYLYRRVRYVSLGANATRLRLLAIAYNLRRADALVSD